MRFVRFVVTTLLLAAPAPALADIVARDAGPIPVPAEAAPPRPEAATTYVVPPEEPRPSRWRRGALAVPRVAAAVAFAPVRLALWTEDHHHVSARAADLFWNDERTIGLYPVAQWDGGASLRGGAAFTAEDVAGATVRATATTGVIDRADLGVTVGSGALLGPVTIEAQARYRELGGTSFYGLGDVPEVQAYFGQEERTARVAARWRLTDDLAVGVGGSRRALDFGDPIDRIEGPALDDAYDATTVPGYLAGIDAVRGEVSIQLDRRRARHRYQSAAVPSTGWGAQAYAGVQRGVGDDGSRFGYGGVDLIRAIDLHGGDRVLSLRGAVDGVFGDPGEVPFVDLPSLGGTELLRGFPSGRFRDRWAAVASAEYLYPVTEGFAGFVFVDAGRVAPAPEALVEDAPRIGGGVGVQVHSRRALSARAWIAATDDGGVAFNVRLEPLFRARGQETIR